MDEKLEKPIAAGFSDRSEKTFSLSHSNSNPVSKTLQLLEVVKTLPKTWGLVAVNNKKAPLYKDWPNLPLTQEDFERAIQVGEFESLLFKSKTGKIFHLPVSRWFAIGVLCGTPSGGILFVDHDGESCDLLIENLANQPVTKALPKTVAVTSGREGRYQLLYKVPKQFWSAISTKTFPTGVKDKDNKPEQLEFRWDGCQSVVAGHHPTTGSYHWLPGQSPQESEIADAPSWIINLMKECPSCQPVQTRHSCQPYFQTWTDRDQACSYLAAIPPAQDYNEWLRVGMALHSVDEDLLADWDDWSRGATNYELGACERHWKSFKSDGGITLGTLKFMAEQNSWRPLFKDDRGEHSASTATQGSSSNRVTFLPQGKADEDFEDFAQEVRSFVELTEEPSPIKALISSCLTNPLMRRAEQFAVPLEAFVGPLLSVTASLLKIGTQLEIVAGSNYRCPPILWTGLVGESGANKSPVLDTILRPLEGLQAQADEVFQVKFAQYEIDLESWQKCNKEERGNKPAPPSQRELFLQDTTLEAIAACLSAQPDRGIVISNDELASLFNGFNQYRSGGRGSDRQKFLSAYDGGAIKVNRKAGSRIYLSQTSISLTGTIQPCVLQKLMGDLNEVDGFWARFKWILLPLTEMPPPSEGTNCDLSSLLRSLYQGLESLAPQVYHLDQQGKAAWRDWHIFCERCKVGEPNPALRAVYPKSKERAARIALVVHCINAVVEGKVPGQIVSGDLLEAAIAFTKWSIGQTRLIYADAGIASYEKTAKIVRFIERFRNRGWVAARDLIHWWSPKPKPKAEPARAFMKEIVNLGYAIDNGETGRRYKICIQDDYGNIGNNCSQNHTPEEVSFGNKRDHNLVTRGNSSSYVLLSPACALRSGVDSALATDSVTTNTSSSNTGSTKASGKSSVELLPSVTPTVTTSEVASSMGFTGICCPVTNATLKVGDRVVLTGQGNCRSPEELKAIWTVTVVQELEVTIWSEALGNRVFPREWLEFYKSNVE